MSDYEDEYQIKQSLGSFAWRRGYRGRSYKETVNVGTGTRGSHLPIPSRALTQKLMGQQHTEKQMIANQRIAERDVNRINTSIRQGKSVGGASTEYGQSLVGAVIGGPLLLHKLGAKYIEEKQLEEIKGGVLENITQKRRVIVVHSKPKTNSGIPKTVNSPNKTIPGKVIVRKVTR